MDIENKAFIVLLAVLRPQIAEFRSLSEIISNSDVLTKYIYIQPVCDLCIDLCTAYAILEHFFINACRFYIYL